MESNSLASYNTCSMVCFVFANQMTLEGQNWSHAVCLQLGILFWNNGMFCPALADNNEREKKNYPRGTKELGRREKGTTIP